MTKNDTTAPAEAGEDERTVFELEEAIRDGADVTAEQLRAARDRDLLAGLHTEADQRRADRKAAAARKAAIERLHADTRACAERSVAADGVFVALEDRLRALGVEYADAVGAHNREVASLGARARALDLTERDGSLVGYAWSPMGGGVVFRRPDGGRGGVRDRSTAAANRALDAGIDEAVQAAARAAAPPRDPDEAALTSSYVLTEGGVPMCLGRLTEAWRRQIDRGELKVITRERYTALVAEQQVSR